MSIEKKKVAVIVPIYKMGLSPEENISLRHLLYYLSKYDKYIVCPHNLKVSYFGFKIKSFHNKFFSGISGYNRLMLSKDFYEAFLNYKFILIYQLDALVFSDELELWCEKNLDYIGAPWFKGYSKNPANGFWAVGNGGFSLRKVESFLRVLNSKICYIDPNLYYKKYFSSKPKIIPYINLPLKILKHMGFRNINWHIRRIIKYKNEDMFWSFDSKIFYPKFKIAPLKEALRFAFEAAPTFCFDRNNHQLPFGCHAWCKYDKNFWEVFLMD